MRFAVVMVFMGWLKDPLLIGSSLKVLWDWELFFSFLKFHQSVLFVFIKEGFGSSFLMAGECGLRFGYIYKGLISITFLEVLAKCT